MSSYLKCAEMATYPLLSATIDSKHRAKLWEDGTRLQVLKTRTPKFNWMIHPAWVDRLKWAGLLPLARLVEATRDEWVQQPAFEEGGEDIDVLETEKSVRMSYDRSLLSCLVDRWRPETHTFHFPWGEMAPTLQDVSFLLGLPLAGGPIGPWDPPLNWRAHMAARFEGINQDVEGMVADKHGPRFSWLRNYQVNYFVVNYYSMNVLFCLALNVFLYQRRLVFWDTRR